MTCSFWKKTILYFLLGSSFFAGIATTAFAKDKLNVLTSTTNLKSLTKYIAGDKVEVSVIIKGFQNPHFLSPKPSYMLKAKKADLLIFAGMDLEVGWLPSIITGSKNPKIQEGQSGHLPASQFIQALSVPEGKVDRFFGDVHPYGNPHYLLDPLRAVQVSKGISEKLSELDPENKEEYLKNQKLFEKEITEKRKDWKKRIQNSGIKKVVTYHSSFEYFLETFQINLVGLIEEKPGIAPSAKHLLNLIKKIKEEQNYCILISSFYNDEPAKKIKSFAPVHIEKLAVEVGAEKTAKDYFSMISAIVQAIENCGAFKQTQRTTK